MGYASLAFRGVPPRQSISGTYVTTAYVEICVLFDATLPTC